MKQETMWASSSQGAPSGLESFKWLGAGVEVFVFHWGCTRLGALGDDKRGPAFVPTEGQCLFSLSWIIFRFPSRLVPSDEVFCTARNEKPPACR